MHPGQSHVSSPELDARLPPRQGNRASLADRAEIFRVPSAGVYSPCPLGDNQLTQTTSGGRDSMHMDEHLSKRLGRPSGIRSIQVGELKVSYVPDGDVPLQPRGWLPASTKHDWAAHPEY